MLPRGRAAQLYVSQQPVDADNINFAVGMLAFGALLALIGDRLRTEYRKLFVDDSRITDQTGPGAPFAAYLGYIASFFFAGALASVASGGYTLVTELWRYFRW